MHIFVNKSDWGHSIPMWTRWGGGLKMSIFLHSEVIKCQNFVRIVAPLLHTQMKYLKFFFCSMLDEKPQSGDIFWEKCESCLLKPDKIWYQTSRRTAQYNEILCENLGSD